MEAEQKYQQMVEQLKSYGSVAVAFSGGVDSTLLLAAAKEALGEQVLAVTVRSDSFPMREFLEAEQCAQTFGVPQQVVTVKEMDIPGFAQNPPDRCYLCKKEIMGAIIGAAKEAGISHVVEGSNTDDLGDYRPGRRAIQELGVHSPLQEAGLSKKEIRQLLKARNLPAWSKPSFACLATRFPYGVTITSQGLAMVEQAEQCLLDLGFTQARVRCHGDLARIEVEEHELQRLMDLRHQVVAGVKAAGFAYVSADLQGYRTGSMNETLKEEDITEKGR